MPFLYLLNQEILNFLEGFISSTYPGEDCLREMAVSAGDYLAGGHIYGYTMKEQIIAFYQPSLSSSTSITLRHEARYSLSTGLKTAINTRSSSTDDVPVAFMFAITPSLMFNF